MARKKKGSKRKHAQVTPDDEANIPKSFVMRSGNVGRTITQLTKDFRKVMQPHTAKRLQERKTNRFRDFVAVSGQLGVTHFMIFSQTESNVNMRICRVPRGPTLHFRVLEYSLAKDCVALYKNPKTSVMDYLAPPLLVLNNFKQEGKQFRVMTAMLQNMFPPIDVQTLQLSSTRRVLLFNYNETNETIDVRHFGIHVKEIGVSKSIKRILKSGMTDLGSYEDISDYILKEAVVSESDVEDGPEGNVELPENYRVRRSNLTQENQRSIRLQEFGPRLTLQLFKIENGLCEGEVLYHRFVQKTKQEVQATEAKRQRLALEKAERREQQEANVEKKQKEKEDRKKQAQSQKPAAADQDEADDEEDDKDEKDNESDDAMDEDDESEPEVIEEDSEEGEDDE
ncbi:Brix domain-domain-containing protein [Syncephalastrum racemosum]|uniref:Brix domain-domain-containing protein n=1 Tax=Syncephalastrum racemosum TaxID=13706 RepID=A0A1X2HQK5_SYNRA|nr:Brix domain-domain-containing protein [Syncephalastrum racemosum]